MKMKLLALLTAGTGALFSFGHANAAINWDLTSAPSVGGTSIYNASTSSTTTYRSTVTEVGNTRTASASEASAPAVTASAWANTGNGVWDSGAATNFYNEGREQIGAKTNSDAYTLESAYLANWGASYGLGVKNRDATSSSNYGDQSEGSSPEHAVDNNQRNDMVLFSFNEAVNLTDVILGWSQQCADITVLAYQGNTPLALDGLNYSTLDNNGWTVIGHYANAAQGSTDITVSLGTNISSSYWLIGAYNPTVGGTSLANGCDGLTITTSTGRTCSGSYTVTSYNAANVKIAGLAGKTGGGDGKVPEPATLGLLGLGLLGLVRARKRVSRSV